MKKAMLGAAFAAGLSSMSAVADKGPSIESHESKELNPKVLVAQESVKDKAKLTLSILNDDIISGQETKSYFSALGIDMNKISGVRLKEKNYDLENRQMVSLKELGISKDVPFTVDNIGPTLDRVMASMREFQPGADKQVAKQLQQSLEQRFSEFTLIDQEVDLLNKLLTIIPDKVEPIAFINAVTGIVNLNKINNVSSLDEGQQITLVSNVWSVMSLLKPEAVGTTLSIVVPRGTKVGAQVLDQPVEYPSMEIDRETVRLISQSGIELPIEMVSGYQESYKRYQDIAQEINSDLGGKIIRIEKQLEKITDEKRRESGEKRIDGMKETLKIVNQGFDELPTDYKIYVLDMLDAGYGLTNSRNKDNLLLASIEALDRTILSEWTDKSHNAIGASADYLLNLGVSKEVVDNIFYSMCDERIKILNIEYELAQQEYNKISREVDKLKKEGEKLDKIIALQKQILGAKNDFSKEDTFASL